MVLGSAQFGRHSSPFPPQGETAALDFFHQWHPADDMLQTIHGNAMPTA
jgi:hypothetical protein